MAAPQFSNFFRQLRGVLARRDTAGLADADLWKRYVQERDGAAFETLVHRRGPMVLSVCRRTLRNEQDAEDAFQATFLVLAKRLNHSDASAPFCPAGNLLVVASSGGIWLIPAPPLDEIQR